MTSFLVLSCYELRNGNPRLLLKKFQSKLGLNRPRSSDPFYEEDAKDSPMAISLQHSLVDIPVPRPEFDPFSSPGALDQRMVLTRSSERSKVCNLESSSTCENDGLSLFADTT